MRIPQTLMVAGMLVIASIAGAQTVRARGADRSLAAAQEQLAARFRPLILHAVAPAATREDRVALVRFLRSEVLPYIVSEGEVVYPLVDSIAGSAGYATVGAVLDHDAIGRFVDELDAQAASANATGFVYPAYALAGVLDTYFAKDQLLVQPILENRLSASDMQALVARMQAQRVAHASARDAGAQAPTGN